VPLATAWGVVKEGPEFPLLPPHLPGTVGAVYEELWRKSSSVKRDSPVTAAGVRAIAVRYVYMYIIYISYRSVSHNISI